MTSPGGTNMSTQDLDRRYRIRAPLRCDGVGSLDCAEDTVSGMRMAIRWLPVDANGEAAVKAVEEMPRHPVLPRIRQTGRVGSAAYVAMEFPEGRLLSTLLDDGFPVEQAVRMGAEIADALTTLHSQDVVHGELSADSILVLSEHRAILWDVPLVMANRLTDRRGEERVMAQLIRVAPFLSPERARGLPASAPGDVYALAAVMSLVAGGQQPPGGTTLAVLHQIANGDWAPEVPRAFPEPIRELMTRMLAADPLSRPSAREVSEALFVRTQQTPTIPEMKAVVIADPAPYSVLSPPPLPVAKPVVEAAAPQATPPMPETAQELESPPAPSVTPEGEAVAASPVEAPSLPVSASGPRPQLAVAAEPSIVLDEDLAAQAALMRAAQRRRWMIAGGSIVAACALIAIVATLAMPKRAEKPRVEPSPAVASAPTPEVRAEEPEALANVDSLLAPLVSADSARPVRKKPAAVARKSAPAPVEPVQAAAPQKRTTPAPAPKPAVVEEAEPTSNGFDFLEQNVAAPTSELKRPSF